MGKKKAKHEHHGGAWKVAYADFVTAMMALFMVLWISAQDQEILLQTSKYFQNPFVTNSASGGGVIDGGGSSSESESDSSSANSAIEMAMLQALAQELFRILRVDEDEESSPIEIEVVADGLRISVFDRSDRQLFEPGSDEFSLWGSLVVQNLAWMMDRNNMRVRVDAHSPSDFPGRNNQYGPFELSLDRGNAVRQSLVHYALAEQKVERVTGFGASTPLPGKPPDDPSQGRIEFSLVLDE
jgi:chemotaxis protein MotB